MNQNQYFAEVMRILQRRIGRMILAGEVRVQDGDDVVQFICEWLLNRPKVMEAYSPAAIVSVATRQRVIEYFRVQQRQSPVLRYVANADDSRMYMEYLDQVMWGPTGFAPIHEVPARDFETGENDTGKGKSLFEKIDSGVDVEQVAEDQMLLQSLLSALSPIQREVFTLVSVEGYTVTEAAEKLGIRRERASIALGKARDKVRQIRDDWNA